MSGMKSSTAKMLFRNRIDAWINSIEDKTVKELVKRDTILSGGAISSAISGDKINDYDLYFRTYETALAVAKYYVDVYNAGNLTPTAPGIKSSAPAVKEEVRVNCKGNSERRVIIYMKSSGVVAETQETYKYFETQPEHATQKFVESLAENEGKSDVEDDFQYIETIATCAALSDNLAKATKLKEYRPIFLSENAITLSNKIQLVVRFSGDPKQIHENYDYAHAMCYYLYHEHDLVLPQEALECMLSKTLIYKGSLYPIASVFRLRKFIDRGWRITAGQMLKILFQVSELDLKDITVLREQLLGVDQAFMHQLLRTIENKESTQKIDATYLANIIDKIFE